jgi:hypothetical protein
MLDKDTVLKPLEPTSNMNKKTSRAVELQRMLQYKLKFDVVGELIDLYRDPDTKPSDKRQILTDLMRYLYPQLKAMEIDTRDGEKICVNIVFPDDNKKKISVDDAIDTLAEHTSEEIVKQLIGA